MTGFGGAVTMAVSRGAVTLPSPVLPVTNNLNAYRILDLVELLGRVMR
jgi:hypothetical protein